MNVVAIIELRKHGVSIDIIRNIVKRVNHESDQRTKKFIDYYKRLIDDVLINEYKEHIKVICPNCEDFHTSDKLQYCDYNCPNIICPSCIIRPPCGMAEKCCVQFCSKQCMKLYIEKTGFKLNKCTCGEHMNCSDCIQDIPDDHLDADGKCPHLE